MGIEQVSRIYVDPASGWSFTMAGSGSANGGGFGTLEVIPAGLVAGGVTFPGSIGGLLQVIFGSSNTSASPRAGSGAAALGGVKTTSAAAIALQPISSPSPPLVSSLSPFGDDGAAPLTFDLSDVITGMPVPQGPGASPWAFTSLARRIAYQGTKRVSMFGQ